MKNAVNKASLDLLNIKHPPQSSKRVNPLSTLSFKGEITNRQHWNTLPRETSQKICGYGTWGYGIVVNMTWLILRVEYGDLQGFCNLNDSVMKNNIVFYILLSISTKYFTVTPYLQVYQNSTVILPQIQLCHVHKWANPLCFWQDLVPFQLFFPQGSELGSVPSAVQWIHKRHEKGSTVRWHLLMIVKLFTVAKAVSK